MSSFRSGPKHLIAQRNATLRLSEKQLQLVYGTLLGDASLSKPNTGVNYHYSITHGEGQKDYLFWKHAILSPLGSQPGRYARVDPRVGREYVTWRFHLPSLPLFTTLRAELYPEGVKRLPLSFLERCDTLALAAWFMDDGSATKGVPCFATVCFPEEDLAAACGWLASKWNITARFSHQRRIWIPRESRADFRALIEPHVPECMAYKLPQPLVTKIERPGARRPIPVVICIICGASFQTRDRRNRACSFHCSRYLSWMVRRGEVPAACPKRAPRTSQPSLF